MTVTRVAHPTLLRTVTVATDAFDLVDVRLTERGYGPVVLLLHGGAGPASVTGYADHLAATRGVRVVTPVHPGFAGTPRPPLLTTAAGLAEVYAALLEELGLDAVTVVGHAVGGWVAAELGLLGSPGSLAWSSWTPSASRPPGSASPTSSRCPSRSWPT